MDYDLSMTKISQLFWLGRYAARVETTIRHLAKWYDIMLDGKDIDYRGFCRSLDIPCPYRDARHFMRSYSFEGKNPDSIRSAAEAMLGNGMVLRETIGSEALAYLQMAVYVLDKAAISPNPCLDFQKIRDLMMAFAGRCDNYIEDQDTRDMIKCGVAVERISLYLSFGYPDWQLRKDVHKLSAYTHRLSLPVAMDLQSLSVLQIQENILSRGGSLTISREDMQYADESLFSL